MLVYELRQPVVYFELLAEELGPCIKVYHMFNRLWPLFLAFAFLLPPSSFPPRKKP